MSASKKKKLRSQEVAQKMTERQMQEQKEAKKLKIYTAIFVVVLVALLAVALISNIFSGVSRGGNEKSTVAMTVGEHSISNAEFNYYFSDNVYGYYQNIQAYASLFGLDPTKPLDQQDCPQMDGTWADYFVLSTQEQIQYVYAMCDAAKADGFELSAEQQATVDQVMAQRKADAAQNNLTLDIYLEAVYGPGSEGSTYEEYLERSMLASSYEYKLLSEASYTDEELRAHEKDIYNHYSSFSYTSAYITADKFLNPVDGTTNEDNTITYSDEVKAQAEADAKAAAEQLKTSGAKTEEEFKAAVEALEISPAATKLAPSTTLNTLYENLNPLFAEWVSSADRKVGDVEVFANTRTTLDAEGKETTVTDGYYVVYFGGSNDNTFELVNVRHVLVKPETDGTSALTEEQIAGAKAQAEEMLNLWKTSGDVSEASFIELAKNNSADSSAADGGLIADIHPYSQLVDEFRNWSLDPNRTVGETGVVTSTYGAHIMYYCGPNGITLRDYMITNVMAAAERDALIEAVTVVPGDVSYVNTGLVLAR